MNLASVYDQLPIFPRFVAIDTMFKGANTVFDGVKNPALSLSDREYEIVEGINVVRSRYEIFRPSSIVSPYQSYGTFWAYKIAPYPTKVSMDGQEGYPSSNYPPYPPLESWDVFNYYVSNNQHQLISRVQSSSSLNWFTGNDRSIYTAGNQLIDKYFDGKWDWDWSWWDDSHDSTTNSNNYTNVFQMKTFPTVVSIGRANYADLLRGYPADNRTVIQKPVIIPLISEKVEVSYYRQNMLEPIPDLKSIDWMFYDCDLKQAVPYELPIVDCCLGTLHVDSLSVKSQLISLSSTSDNYDLKYLFSENLANLFDEWNTNQPIVNNNILRVLSANNDHWLNRQVATVDQGVDITHPMFAIDNQRAYDWHIKPQTNGSYGNLVMDSPRTIEIYTALNAGQYLIESPAIIGTGTIDNPQIPATHKLDWYIKNSAGEKVTAIWKALGGNKYGTNQLDNTKNRVTNLGFLVERIAKVLGIRFDDNGKIEVEKEKAIVRKVIDGTKNVDPEKVGVNGFGDGGLVVKRINNRFKQKGEIVSDQCVVLQDIPDLIQEYFEQANLALGIQESSAIEIKQDGTAARFNSQLEILVELVNLMSSGNEMTRAALVSSLVTQSQTNELIAGLGLPSVTKTIPIKIGKKVSQLPFKGIAAHRSISQEIATCTYNVGIATGQLL